MDLYYLEKNRFDLLDDHPYAQSVNDSDSQDCGDAILLHGNVDLSAMGSSAQADQWIDVVDDANPSVSNFRSTEAFIHPELHNELKPVEMDKRNNWIVDEKFVQRNMLRLLERCFLQESIDIDRFTDLSDLACLQRRRANRHLRIRRIARGIRNTMTMLSWCLENCFTFHQWCLTHLPVDLLRLYCDGYKDLWRQNKATSLLAALNRLVIDRGLASSFTLDSPTHELLQLSVIGNSLNKRSDPALKTSLSARAGWHSSSLPVRRTMTAENSTDQPILVCLTFPASRNSNRLCSLLQELSAIGHISVETPEEQCCDMMRLRLRLYIRRVLMRLQEPKHCPTYLVGFGVGSILVLLAWLHLYSLQVRCERPGIAGIVCIGIPLVGLKGSRGFPSDQLLTVPELPTLFVVGSDSRLGSKSQALYFRRQLAMAQRRANIGRTTPEHTDDDQAVCDSLSSDSNRPAKNSGQNETRSTSGIQVLTVGGADHLLRLRPFTCARLCTTQEAVDKRVVATIQRFVHQTERLAHNSVLEYSSNESDVSTKCEPARTPSLKTAQSLGCRNPSPQLFPLSSASVYAVENGSSHPHLSHTRKLHHSYLRRPYLGAAGPNYCGSYMDC
ncbi:hypothetical protein P879_08942 [Paragonimus westermani]|uniref:KAT8 regulatory NSL complex subunit 3 n=1 Tax=Paragonimus westermani TaxID=34504 RepID=A0A8T0D6V0_9TREM|nr:hypothetical protein P879_08942 [Paragonimus westermani]